MNFLLKTYNCYLSKTLLDTLNRIFTGLDIDIFITPFIFDIQILLKINKFPKHPIFNQPILPIPKCIIIKIVSFITLNFKEITIEKIKEETDYYFFIGKISYNKISKIDSI